MRFFRLSVAAVLAVNIQIVSGFTSSLQIHIDSALQVNNTNRRRNQSSSSALHSSAVSKSMVNTPSKYPTERGSTSDPRKVVSSKYITAVRLSHVLCLDLSLAEIALAKLKGPSNNADSSVLQDDVKPVFQSFEDLAASLSACESTKDSGGDLGWMGVTPIDNPSSNNDRQILLLDNGKNEHMDELLPLQARIQILATSTKPGDTFIITSDKGFHIIKIQDVMQNVRAMAKKKLRKNLTVDSDFDFEGKRYKMETMGCQMNIADSERIEGQLQTLGMSPFIDDDDTSKQKDYPEVVILNTCSIRDHAEQKVYSYIGPYAKRKREGKDVTIIVAGCVAQQEGEALLRRAPEVDLVMGPQYANRIADLLEDVSNGNQVVATEATHIMEDSTKPRRSSKVAAWVNVIYGCNERCTYCIVPTTRGVEQSRPVESIVQEVEELVEQGFKEVTLLGQNIDAYGRDMNPKRKFSDLIRTVGNIEGLERLRFVTSHPKYMSLGVVDAVAETPAACESFHVPFQSGSDAILNSMGRGHTREKYLQIIERIRSKLPDASISADVIVGFPGETDEDFEDTLDLMRKVEFDTVNTAAYSPRPNTPAAVWENQLSDEVKMSRLRRINELNLEHAAKRRARMLGRTVDVLIEERNVKKPSQVMGRTTHGYIVYCDGEIDELRGEVVQVEIQETATYYLSGVRVVV